MQGRLLLDVVVGEGPAVLELLACKDETLLVRGDALLVLDLLLDVVNGVRWLDVKGDGLACEAERQTWVSKTIKIYGRRNFTHVLTKTMVESCRAENGSNG